MGSHRILLTAGSNAKGQLGIGSYDDAPTFTPCQFAQCEPNQLPDLTSRVTHAACGANHTVLLLEHLDGSTILWGTGDGRRGQLGLGYPREEADPAPWTVFHPLVLPPLPVPKSYASRGYAYKFIAAAWETTYVVLARPASSDVLLSMGSNEFGALGVGEGVEASESGRNGPGGEPRVVDFDHIFPVDSGRHTQPRTMYVRSLHAGPRHVVAQLVMASAADGSSSHSVLVGWGASRHGQLGPQGGVRFVARPTRLPINIEEDPMISCALGNQHTVVLHESGRISALGSNRQGQIPPASSRKRIHRLGCTWNGTYMQTTDGDKLVLLSTGNNAQGQLGRGYTVESISALDTTVSLPVDRTISRFVCGSEHVLAAMSSSSQEGNSVVGWGWNEHGNMGLGSLGNIAIPTQLWPRDDMEVYNKYPQKVIDIWAGCATSWLLVE
ncbi:regulator of chromosome condensation 1/beta-lactamase-inhibitor protein II [Boletus coccyginus]|nr:regulator of chromosome condensation 1/beta-lactamase-inhibitor protein II [Boletus coccyginus]